MIVKDVYTSVTLSSFFATSPSNTGAPRLDVGCHSQDPFYGSQKKTTNTPRILFKNAISCNKVFCMKSAQSMSSQLTKLNKTEQCLASTMLHSVHLCKTLAVNHTNFFSEWNDSVDRLSISICLCSILPMLFHTNRHLYFFALCPRGFGQPAALENVSLVRLAVTKWHDCVL